MPVRFALSGGSGLIGAALARSLRLDGHEVTTLVRGRSRNKDDEVVWDPNRGELDVASLDGCGVIVNLSGAPLADGRLTPARKVEVHQSRVKATTLLSQAAASILPAGGVLVNASAIGFYGDRGDEELTEESSRGSGFLAELCRDWEAATAPAEKAGVRVVHLRTGIVLAKEGGALKKQLPLFRLGLGGSLGTGRQWTSWISLGDEVAVIRHAIDNPGVSGPLNAVSPEPVTNAGFTKVLARAVHRPAVFKVPAPILKVAFGAEFADELLLVSQRVLPAQLAATGFRFTDESLDSAIESILSAPT
jgi:uncharacterized protein (TIGR01777 family)